MAVGRNSKGARHVARLLGSVGRVLCAAAACAASLAFATPEVDRAIAWLQAQPNGSLSGEAASIATPYQARTEVVAALKQLATAPADRAVVIVPVAPLRDHPRGEPGPATSRTTPTTTPTAGPAPSPTPTGW